MIHWFKKHPTYLDKEVKALELDSNYRQTMLVRDNLLISQGYILVRMEKVHRFPFLIIYPNATPYALPLFFPLKAELTLEMVQELSALDEERAFESIRKEVHYYYELRHQNASGMLCTVEWQSLENESSFLGIKTLIKRVTEWCRGTITGNFPPDSEEVEFTGHFNDILPGVHFLYPGSFLSTHATEGEAYATLYTRVPAGEFYKQGQIGYLGRIIFGRTKGGLYEQSDQVFPKQMVDEGILNETTLLEKASVVERLLAQGEDLIRIFWFDLDREPEPFVDFSALISLIGGNDLQQGAERMASVCLDQLKKKPAEFFVGIRFSGRKGQREFQLLKVFKTSEDAPVLFGAGQAEALLSIANDYTRVSALISKLFSDEAFHLRNQGRANREVLQEKIVHLIGVGAVGSEVADMLGKAGVGFMALIDNQRMNIENNIRHLVGIDYAGVPKVDAVKTMVAMHNPFIEIRSMPWNINQIPIVDFITGSISVSSLAEDNTEAFLNERAVILGHTVYYVRALRGGKVGRIFRVVPGKDACMRCLELYRLEGDQFISIAEDTNLPVLRTECNNPVRPASAADLKLIAALASRIILDELEGGTRAHNHWLWSTEAISGLEPYQLKAQVIAPHPKCIYCHHDRKAKVLIDPRCLAFLQGLVRASPRIETGGVLAGYIDEAENFVVTHGSAPGTNATRSATTFKKDVEFCQAFLDDLSSKTGNKTCYLGEWHSHPSENNLPSGTDIQSLSEISYQKEYLTDRPLMVIFSSGGSPSATVHPTGKRYYHTQIEMTEYS